MRVRRARKKHDCNGVVTLTTSTDLRKLGGPIDWRLWRDPVCESSTIEVGALYVASAMLEDGTVEQLRCCLACSLEYRAIEKIEQPVVSNQGAN
jgi:hypothetical protein